MDLFDKMFPVTYSYSYVNSGRKKIEYLFPSGNKEVESETILFPRPNDDIECIVPLFNTQKHYKHLKKMMWKYRR